MPVNREEKTAKHPKFSDKPLKKKTSPEQQHRREVMHWKQRMRKLRNYNRLWSQY